MWVKLNRKRISEILALVFGGWFLHDSVLHLGMLTVPWLIAYELGLPTNLSERGINPESTSQLAGLLFAVSACLILLYFGLNQVDTRG